MSLSLPGDWFYECAYSDKSLTVGEIPGGCVESVFWVDRARGGGRRDRCGFWLSLWGVGEGVTRQVLYTDSGGLQCSM